MQYTMEDVERALGEDFDPEAEYVITTHAGSVEKGREGWKVVCNLPDFTADDNGTVLVMARSKKEPAGHRPSAAGLIGRIFKGGSNG